MLSYVSLVDYLMHSWNINNYFRNALWTLDLQWEFCSPFLYFETSPVKWTNVILGCLAVRAWSNILTWHRGHALIMKEAPSSEGLSLHSDGLMLATSTKRGSLGCIIFGSRTLRLRRSIAWTKRRKSIKKRHEAHWQTPVDQTSDPEYRNFSWVKPMRARSWEKVGNEF